VPTAADISSRDPSTDADQKCGYTYSPVFSVHEILGSVLINEIGTRSLRLLRSLGA
jgi:hypothetical protein